MFVALYPSAANPFMAIREQFYTEVCRQVFNSAYYRNEATYQNNVQINTETIEIREGDQRVGDILDMHLRCETIKNGLTKYYTLFHGYSSFYSVFVSKARTDQLDIFEFESEIRFIAAMDDRV